MGVTSLGDSCLAHAGLVRFESTAARRVTALDKRGALRLNARGVGAVKQMGCVGGTGGAGGPELGGVEAKLQFDAG